MWKGTRNRQRSPIAVARDKAARGKSSTAAAAGASRNKSRNGSRNRQRWWTLDTHFDRTGMPRCRLYEGQSLEKRFHPQKHLLLFPLLSSPPQTTVSLPTTLPLLLFGLVVLEHILSSCLYIDNYNLFENSDCVVESNCHSLLKHNNRQTFHRNVKAFLVHKHQHHTQSFQLATIKYQKCSSLPLLF